MKFCVAVLDVGFIDYSAISKCILVDYFTRHNIPFYFITEKDISDKQIQTKESHPSWWKLIIHKILPGFDFIICWDLDLLPRLPSSKIIEHFDFSKLNLAFDSPGNKVSFSPNFKYNGGLIGIPSSVAFFMEYIFDTHAPGVVPSYEQYYLNEEIAHKKVPVHELPRNINVLYPKNIEERPAFYNALCQHYTYGYESSQNRVQLIQNHADTYFSNSESFLLPTRNDLVKEFINKKSYIAEIGVFKGDFSRFLYNELDPTYLALFDLFTGYCGSGNHDGNNMEFVQLEVEYFKLKEEYKDKNVIFHKGDSSSYLTMYEDNYFDFIYIDAEHTYDSVKKDLLLSYSKIKNNGFIMGHDYDVNPQKTPIHYDYAGVRKAVEEFCTEKNVKILAKGMDGCISFCIQIIKT